MKTKLLILLTLFVIPMVGYSMDNTAVTDQFEKARRLTPNIENGQKMYETCKTCHRSNGWGSKGGHYPQIAGQLKDVIIKQLLDIQNGKRGNPMMSPFTSPRFLPDAQSIADVSAYISQLPMTGDNGVGNGFYLENAKSLYEKHCEDCHGFNASGEVKRQVPALRAQHYNYLTRQFDWIKNGIRKNADKEMVQQIKDIPYRDWLDILDYTSRIPPNK